MRHLATLCCFAAVTSANALIPSSKQQPLEDAAGAGDLIDELKTAEIIPAVLDVFTPLLAIEALWEHALAEVGNTIPPSDLQKQPYVNFLRHAPSDGHDDVWLTKKHPQLTLALTDPDAPSRDNPKWSEVCHWLTTRVPLVDPESPSSSPHVVVREKLHDIMPYKPPGPPPKTGKHRYVLVALAPKNGTTEALHLRKPDERRTWGYGGEERVGVRKWAEEMGLVVVGANFIYAQDEDQ